MVHPTRSICRPTRTLSRGAGTEGTAVTTTHTQFGSRWRRWRSSSYNRRRRWDYASWRRANRRPRGRAGRSGPTARTGVLPVEQIHYASNVHILPGVYKALTRQEIVTQIHHARTVREFIAAHPGTSAVSGAPGERALCGAFPQVDADALTASGFAWVFEPVSSAAQALS